MVKVNYDPLTGEIKGFYPDFIVYVEIPEPYIEVDATTHQDCINNQGLRRVDLTTLKITSCSPLEPSNNDKIKQQIAELESQQTTRRIREATLGIDNGWFKNLNDQIAALRAQLS